MQDGLLNIKQAKASGKGIEALKKALTNDECAWVVYKLEEQNTIRLK